MAARATGKLTQNDKLCAGEIKAYRLSCVEIVCAAIATSDKGLRRICDARKVEDPNFPSKSTVLRWFDEDHELADLYARGKALQADHIFDQILEIADDSSEDEIFVGEDDESGASGKRVMNSEFVQRSKLRIDARKWVVSKLLPKKYGDRIEEKESAESYADAFAKLVAKLPD